MGEIDILCHDPKTNCIVVVEVKARIRSSGSTPNPESSVTAAKQRKLRTLARAVSRRDECKGRGIRIDVIAVEFEDQKLAPVALRHYVSAV